MAEHHYPRKQKYIYCFYSFVMHVSTFLLSFIILVYIISYYTVLQSPSEIAVMSLEHSAFRREILVVATHSVKKKGTLCLVHRVELPVKKKTLLIASSPPARFLSLSSPFSSCENNLGGAL